MLVFTNLLLLLLSEEFNGLPDHAGQPAEAKMFADPAFRTACMPATNYFMV
jgi:hypothetical protein